MGKENNTLQNTDNLSGFYHRFSTADWTQTNGGRHIDAQPRLMALMFTSAMTGSCGAGLTDGGTHQRLRLCLRGQTSSVLVPNTF